MRFLSKKETSPIKEDDLKYENPSERKRIKTILQQEQHGYCAYSEKRLEPLDSCEIEHFDPRLKGTEKDGYQNWYAVIRWMNAHKAKKIEAFLPILHSSSHLLREQISYDPKNSIYVCNDENDEKAENLLQFLGVNKEEVVQARKNHIKLIQSVRTMCANEEELFPLLKKNINFLHDPTALQEELGLEISAIYLDE